jgi:HSP20 family protein
MSLGLIQRSRVHPWAVLREAERTLGQLQPRIVRPAGAQRPFDPRIEAHETESGWEVSAELPGVAREDLEVFVQEGVLTIRGARRFGRREAQAIEATTAGAEPAEADAEAAEAADASAAETEDASALRFERRIRFNGDVDEDAVSARYADGLLEVGVPRLVPPEPEVRTIPIQVA